MAIGSLVVQVSSSGASIPIPNALVTVYNSGDESNAVAIRYTDSNGKTEKMELDAKPKSLSETPGDKGELPYTVYNVSVKADGFYEVFNLEVPIFEGITAILPVNMLPLPQAGHGGITPESGTVIENLEPNLNGEVG